ncbi:MAG: alpha/beta hydrolase [Gammaproteobacteria bacterium]|nr:alpha/beta hydrolase [Gammaproteobacteria bacterium]
MKEFGSLSLWEGEVPQATGSGPVHEPRLTIHLPSPDNATGCGVLVAPGGGYRILASDHEGLQVAQAFNELGIAAFVLRYRVAPTYSSAISLLDGQRAIRILRYKSSEYGISRLGMLGFSAGGHLAANVGTDRWLVEGECIDPVDAMSARPDFLALCYAVTNGIVRGRKADEYTPTDTRVNAETPPTFLMHTHQDEIVPTEQSMIFYNALHRHRVPSEMHVFGSGEHGVGLASGDPDTNLWFSLLHNWIRRQGFLTSKQRVEVSGQVLINGHLPGHIWLTLEPMDRNAPSARVRIDPSSKGEFKIHKESGPVNGPHIATVRHISDKISQDAIGDYTLDREIVYSQKVALSADTRLNLQLTERNRC